MSFKIITFNTGRAYSEHGQRIAACSIDGGVFMSDIDRHLEYFLPDCTLHQGEIMAHYDSTARKDQTPPCCDQLDGQCWTLEDSERRLERLNNLRDQLTPRSPGRNDSRRAAIARASRRLARHTLQVFRFFSPLAVPAFQHKKERKSLDQMPHKICQRKRSIQPLHVRILALNPNQYILTY